MKKIISLFLVLIAIVTLVSCNDNKILSTPTNISLSEQGLISWDPVANATSYVVLINGESVGQVASQTLTSMQVINNVTNVPVLRPVCCLDKLEIIDISKKIDTYETSILPYEDCCTIFLPKHPVINPELEKAINYENNFDYETLINEAVENIEIIKINSNEDKFLF